jgi:uncharacterized protein (TIGR02598 family)
MKEELSKKSGFSLVEVTIALAVTTFALTSVLALMPIAMKSYRESRLDTIRAQAADIVHARLQKVDFQSIPAGMGFPWYLDYDGVDVGVADAVYRVEAEVQAEDSTLKQLQIEIFHQAGGDVITRFPVLTSDHGRP